MTIRLEAAEDVQNADLMENGKWVHIRALPKPGEDEGEPLYLKGPDGKPDMKKPFRILTRSARSKYFRTRDLRIQTLASSKAQRAPRKDQDAIIEQSIAEERPQRFSFLAAAIENASNDQPGVIHPDPKDLIELAKVGAYQFVVDQVMNYAFTDRNYGNEAEVAAYGEDDDSGNAPAGAAAPPPPAPTEDPTPQG